MSKQGLFFQNSKILDPSIKTEYPNKHVAF